MLYARELCTLVSADVRRQPPDALGLPQLTRLPRAFFSKLKERNHLKEDDWRYFIEHATLAPVRTLTWILFVAFLIDLSARYFGLIERFSNVALLRNTGVIACLAWFLLRWKRVFLHAAASRNAQGKSSLIDVVAKFFTIIVIFISLLLILQIFGLNIGPLIAFGGIGAAALGFACKDVIANFCGGLMIHLSRPFGVHDLIELPQMKILGHIEEIGWYFTTVRDLHKKPIYVPNSVFSTEYLVNPSRRTHRRIEEKISLRFADAGKVERLIEKIRDLLANHPEIDNTQFIHVYLLAFGQSSIDIEVKAYTISTREETFLALKQAILLRIYAIIQDEGAEMPFPITEVFLHQNS